MMETKRVIVDALREAGILVAEEELRQAHLDLSGYFQDSLQFISFVFALEQALGIDLPGELLNYRAVSDLGQFAKAVDQLRESAGCC